ncbi:MAG: hypothetical protein GEV11_13660 [Streptosporangiales bacterium]|nr:hypothetical protein [Streptosporangiales bacterium]
MDRPRLGEYRTELVRRVQPVVERDVSLIAAELRRESGGPVDVSVRAVTAESLAERVAQIGHREGRSASGTDVPDALGARITVGDAGRLATLVDRVRQRYAGGPSGRILEIDDRTPGARGPGEQGPGGAGVRENTPAGYGPGARGPGGAGVRENAPAGYRPGAQGSGAHDVRITVGTESSGRPYAFTLWLAAREGGSDSGRGAERSGRTAAPPEDRPPAPGGPA